MNFVPPDLTPAGPELLLLVLACVVLVADVYLGARLRNLAAIGVRFGWEDFAAGAAELCGACPTMTTAGRQAQRLVLRFSRSAAVDLLAIPALEQHDGRLRVEHGIEQLVVALAVRHLERRRLLQCWCWRDMRPERFELPTF